MNVVVTGGSGFVGRHLLEKLSADERIEHIYCLFRKRQPCLLPKVTEIIGDITSWTFSAPEPVSCMIHLAGSAGRSSSSSSIRSANIEGTKNILDICKKNTIANIIYTSSINVHLTHKQAYGKSKLAAESLIRSSGCQFTIFRPALIYGPGNPQGAISKIATLVGRYHLMPIFGDGTALEQPIYIDDLVEILYRAIFMPGTNTLFPVGGGDALSYTALVDAIARRLNTAYVKIHVPYVRLCRILQKFEARDMVFALSVEQIAHQVQDLCIDNSAASATFGVFPRTFTRGLAYLHHYDA